MCLLTGTLPCLQGTLWQGLQSSHLRIAGLARQTTPVMIQSRCSLSSKENRKCNRTPKRQRPTLTSEMRAGPMGKGSLGCVLKYGYDFRGWGRAGGGHSHFYFFLQKKKKSEQRRRGAVVVQGGCTVRCMVGMQLGMGEKNSPFQWEVGPPSPARCCLVLGTTRMQSNSHDPLHPQILLVPACALVDYRHPENLK